MAQAPGDEAAIREPIARDVDARERRDPRGVAVLFTPDAGQLVSSGEWCNGREAVATGTLASSQRTEGRRSITVQRVRFVTSDVAIADGRYETAGVTGGDTRTMWSTFVLAKTPDGWRIAAIRNMLPAPATPNRGSPR